MHMCDTLFFRSAKNPDDALFAKNSDRHPAERQIFHFAPGSRELTDTLLYDPPDHYRKGPWRHLSEVFPSFSHPYGAFISRPVWMWGAEMGVNEHGLAIGNEALFSLKETPKHDGLLGMDMLRLALHNCRHAEAAADLLIRLIEEKGQGGNGSDHGSLYYHNGFLISDPSRSLVLETADRRWALREIRSSGSISNDYSLGTRGIEADRCSPGENAAQFGARFRSPIHGIITRGSTRRRRTTGLASEASGQKASLTPGRGDPLFRNGARILRDHDGPGMSSVCMHSPLWPKSETTASMMVRYHKERFVIWYTGTPLPCRSHFKPVCFQEDTEAELEEEFSDSPAVVARYENDRRSIREMTGPPSARDAEETRTSETVTRELCCGTGTSLAAACRQARETAGDLVAAAGSD
jgi:hypothetical protein